MSAFKLPGVSNAVSGIGVPSPNFLGRETAMNQQTTGLLTGFGQAAPKASPVISDKLLKSIFSILSLYFSILRRFIPSSVLNFLVFMIPPLIAFYELALRGYFPRLPSVFVIAFKLHQQGVLTMGTVIWLASSLPADFLGGFGAMGGVAMKATAAMAGGAASIATVGVNGAGALAGGTTQALAGGLSIVKNGQTVIADNVAHLVSGEHGLLAPDIAKDGIRAVMGNTNAITGATIGATQAAASEGATKLANVLGSVNPLHVNLIPKGSGSQDPQQSQLVSGERGIISSESLVPDVAKGQIQSVLGNVNALAGAAMQPAAKPLAVIGATRAAVTENATKVTNVLESVNPLHLNIMPKGSQASQANPFGGLRPKLPGL